MHFQCIQIKVLYINERDTQKVFNFIQINMGAGTRPNSAIWTIWRPQRSTFNERLLNRSCLYYWKGYPALWEPYILRRVDQLDTMVFGHFKYAARHFMTSKWFFEVFEVEGRGRDSRSKLTVQHKMGYRWNRLDLRNSKMSTEKSGTGSVRF